MQVFINTADKKNYSIDVEPKMTIFELKKRIEAKSKIPIEDINVVYKGRTLKNEITIDKAGIKDKDRLNIAKVSEEAKGEEIDLVLKANDKSPVGLGLESTVMTFKKSDTIKEVIGKICDKSGGDPDRILIYHKGQRLEKHTKINETTISKNDMVLLITQVDGGFL